MIDLADLSKEIEINQLKGEVTCEDRPGRVRDELSTIRPPSTHYSYGEEQLSFGGGAPKERPGGTQLRLRN